MQESGNFGQPYQPPIPSPTGDPNYGSTPPPPGPAEVNFDVITKAWEILKPNMGVWVIAFLIYLGITFTISFIIGLITGGSQTVQIPTGGVPGQFPASPATPNLPVLILSNLIQFVIGQFLLSGIYRMAIQQVRGRAPQLGAMFSVGDVLPSVLGAAILTTLATFAGVLFCIVPGLLLSGLFMFTIPLIVDRKLGAIDAMATSFNTLKSQMWMALAFALVIGLLSGAGILLCCVGIFVTAPLGILSLATLYRDFFPEPSPA